MTAQPDVDRTVMPYAARRNHWNNHVERHGFAVPDRPAFRFQGRTTTWAQLRDRVRALADAMSRRGVSSGWGETPVAVVALRDGAAALDIGELRSWAAQFLARYKLPTDLSLVDALPRNASGKVVKDDVRRRVGQAPPG